MGNFKLPYFGNLDPASLEEYYDSDIDYNGIKIQIDLNFEDKTIDVKRLETAKQFIDNLRIHDLNNKKYIQNDFDNNGSTVPFYLEHHIEELPTDDLNQLVGAGTKAADQPKHLLKKLHIVRVGLYPDSVEQFAVFDYSIGKDLTDQLVVIFTDENGNLDYITMES